MVLCGLRSVLHRDVSLLRFLAFCDEAAFDCFALKYLARRKLTNESQFYDWME